MQSTLGRVLMPASKNAEDFAASLRRRDQAARGLEKDLLTEVPLLYGSPGSMEPQGDPGIVIARLHQEELQRRNDGGLPPSKRARSDVLLPFERATAILPFVLLLLLALVG